ncbi:hypothetical protein F4806DRAFT_492229 [Annulohypoxylon nitens]|nr:hypothetical protein F4806DRAFT_492229 [Annulohypoxylon nitens]
MPLRTLRRLVDMTAAEHTENPESAHVGTGWGRTSNSRRKHLLPGPDAPEIRRRVKVVRARSARVAAERLEATRVRVALKNRGRRLAEGVSGDYCYVRRVSW